MVTMTTGMTASTALDAIITMPTAAPPDGPPNDRRRPTQGGLPFQEMGAQATAAGTRFISDASSTMERQAGGKIWRGRPAPQPSNAPQAQTKPAGAQVVARRPQSMPPNSEGNPRSALNDHKPKVERTEMPWSRVIAVRRV